MASDNDNGGLYLLVGGLLVAVIVGGFIVFHSPGANYADIAPAGGTPSYSSTTTRNTTTTPDTDRGAAAAPDSTTTSKTRTETTNH